MDRDRSISGSLLIGGVKDRHSRTVKMHIKYTFFTVEMQFPEVTPNRELVDACLKYESVRCVSDRVATFDIIGKHEYLTHIHTLRKIINKIKKSSRPNI